MAYKRVNPDRPLTEAERQRRYRERRKQKLELITTTTIPIINIDIEQLRDEIKKELKEEWEKYYKNERLAAERKKGRELAQKADHNRAQGITIGICKAASYFIGIERVDITMALLSHFCIDRETAKSALEADKRTKSMTLEYMDKYKVWGKEI